MLASEPSLPEHRGRETKNQDKRLCRSTPCVSCPKVPETQGPWTTARCNRLLRPLSSKIASLRRLNSLKFPNREITPCSNDTDTHPWDLWSDVPGEDRARKRLKRTYRCARNPAAPTCPSQPTITKTVSLLVTSETARIDPDLGLLGNVRTCGKRNTDEFRELARKLSPTNWRMFDGLYENLDALLRATTLGASHSAPRSLLATVLKQIPGYITEEQLRIHEEDSDENLDVATTVYDDLEALGTSNIHGWKPLREVVRAHGIRILADAVEESLVNLPLARGLVILCLHREAHDEAQTIVESMLRMMKPLPTPSCMYDKLFAQSIPLQTMALIHCSNGSVSLAFMYRQLANLFRTGVLPLEWIGCRDFITLWDKMVTSITYDDANALQAVELLRAVVALSYRQPAELDEKLELLRRQEKQPDKQGDQSNTNIFAPCTDTRPFDLYHEKLEEQLGFRAKALRTIENLLTVLSAVAILQKSIGTCLGDIGIEAQKVQEVFLSTSAEISWDQLGWTLFASSLMCIEDDEGLQIPMERFVDSNAPYSKSEEYFRRVGQFLCNVAGCCGKAVNEDSFINLQNLLKGLNHMSTSNTSTQRTRDRISLHAAFQFAEGTSQPEHLQWALNTERMANRALSAQTTHTPIKTAFNNGFSSRSGYRWEEGICEWVARTPAGTIKGLERDDRPEAEAKYHAGNEGNAPDLSLSLRNVLSPNVSPCLKRKWKPLGDQESDCSQMIAETTGPVLEHTDEEALRAFVTARTKRGSSDVEDTSYGEADELSGSSTSISATSSQQSVSASPKIRSIDRTRKSLPFQSLGGSQWLKRATSTPLVRVELEESEDELSFC